MTSGCGHLANLQARHGGRGSPSRQERPRRVVLDDQPRAIVPAFPAPSLPPPMPVAMRHPDWDIPAEDFSKPLSTGHKTMSWAHSFAMVPRPAKEDAEPKPVRGTPPPATSPEPSRQMQTPSAPIPAPDPVPEAHKVFDSMAQSRSHVRTFDLGQIDMDAHLDRIERAVSMGTDPKKAAPPPPQEATPLDEFDLLSEVASISDDLFEAPEMPTTPEAVADIPAEPATPETPEELPQTNLTSDDASPALATAETEESSDIARPPTPATPPDPQPETDAPIEADEPQHQEIEDAEFTDIPVPDDGAGEKEHPDLLDLPTIGMLILADIHGLSPDRDAMLNGRDGWQAFDELPRAISLPALKKAAGLRSALISAEELLGHEDWPAVLLGDLKARTAILLTGKDDALLRVAGPDGGARSISPDAVLAALESPQTLTIATIADSPVTAALSNLTGG